MSHDAAPEVPDGEPFAATLASDDGSVPGPEVSLTAAQIEANLTETVAQVLASPYFALR